MRSSCCRFLRSGLVVALMLIACREPVKPAKPFSPVDEAAALAADKPVSADVQKAQADLLAMPADATLPLDPAIKKGKLANGLTYYILPHKKPAGRAMVWLAVDAGSVLEDDDQRGLAHFVEHMAFNGTKRFPKHEIINTMRSWGMDFGADLNAHTSFDETVYKLRVPTDKPTYVATALDMLRDWAADVTFEPKEVDAERGVVNEERRLGVGAQQRMMERTLGVLFGAAYGNRFPIGTEDVILKAPRERLVQFYRDWYRPDLMAVFVVGDIVTADIEPLIAAKFGDLVGPKNPRPRPVVPVPTGRQLQTRVDTDPELPVTVASAMSVRPHASELSRNDYATWMAGLIGTAAIAERFRDLAKDPKSPLVAAFPQIDSAGRTGDLMGIVGIAKPGREKDALALVLSERARFIEKGPSQGELDRARANMIAQMKSSAAEAANQDAQDLVEEATRNFLENELMIGRVAEAALSEAVLNPLTIEDVRREWQTFAGGNTLISITGPGKQPLPTNEEVAAIAASIKVATVVDEVVPASLMEKSQLPAPGKITSEVQHPAVGATEWTLSNGVRVIWKPTTFEADTLHLSAISPGGRAYIAKNDLAAVNAALEVASASGLGAHTGPMITKILAGKSATLQTWISRQGEGFTGQAATADAEALFQQVYLALTAPRFDNDAWQAWRESTLASLAQEANDPETLGERERSLRLRKGHPATAPLTAATVKKLTLAQLRRVYTQRFANPADFVFVIVGRAEANAVRALVEQYVGSLATKPKRETMKSLRDPYASGQKVWEVKAGNEAKAEVHITSVIPGAWSRDAEADAANVGALIGERLNNRLREEMGGVYGVSAWISRPRETGAPTELMIRFGCDPKNIAALEAAIKEELQRLATSGATDSELADRKAVIARDRELALATNGYWLRVLSEAAVWNEPLDRATDERPTAARAKNEFVQALAKQFDGKSWLVVHRVAK